MSEHQPSNPEHEPRPEELHPRVWIGSLADYNAGILTGDWIDAAVSDEELVDAAGGVVERSETPDAEEWAIFDYDDFGTWKPGEYEDLRIVAAVARGIREHGEAFAAWAELHDAEGTMLASFEDAYLGEYDSAEAWAESVIDDLNLQARIDEALPQELARYVRFDAEAWAQDAWLNGDIHIIHKPGGGIWIFDTRA